MRESRDSRAELDSGGPVGLKGVAHERQAETEAAGVASVFRKAEDSGKAAEPQPSDCCRWAEKNGSSAARAAATRRGIEAVTR